MLLSKRKVDLVSILVPILTVAFISSERTGFWDRVRGLDLAERAAKRFDLSYAADASTPVRVGDPEWRPLLSLIEAYSIASLPKGREPRVIARHVAIASAKTQIGPDQIMEWTAPSTPLLLLYRDWPGDDLPPSDVKIVGTIGDLHRWIDQSKADF